MSKKKVSKKKIKNKKIPKEKIYAMLLLYLTLGMLIGVLIDYPLYPNLSEYEEFNMVLEDIGDWSCITSEKTHCPTFNLKEKLKMRGIDTISECMIDEEGNRIFWLSLTLDGELYYLDAETGTLFKPEYSYYKPIDWDECVKRGSLIGG